MGTTTPRLVVVGFGMVAHRLVDLIADSETEWAVTVIGEEPCFGYDRVHLSSLFDGATPDDLALGLEWPGVDLVLSDRVVSIDRGATTVTTASGRVLAYDALVVATGSSPFVPPVPGHDGIGAFVYRTIADVGAITEYATGRHRGAVIGGGLLGLEAAGALRSLGLDVHVVEAAPQLMPMQVCERGSLALQRRIEDLGVTVHTAAMTEAVMLDDDARVTGLRLAGAAGAIDVDLVVFSAGIRPRDELARHAGIAVGERGGIAVDDQCRTEDRRIFAIGECAHAAGRTWGLVAPGYRMAEVVADVLSGSGHTRFTGADMSTKLKLLGIDVASFGDAFGATEGSVAVTYDDPVDAVYRRVVLDPATRRVLGGVLVGDASGYDALAQMARGDRLTPSEVGSLAAPAATADLDDPGALAGSATICSCNNVSKDQICAAVAGDGGGMVTDVTAIKACTRAGTGCGGCLPQVTALVNDELRRAGVAIDTSLCEHFAHTRQELFELISVEGVRSFSELLSRHGQGRGCEVCKPAVASILASTTNGYILDGEQASLQDTNDHFLANIQKDGTYSIVPRVPGGEITAEQLIVIGTVARDFGLYTKITGGQRIDLLGARVDQLPEIWSRLVAAGMESGHAYGKALRTVKSCVGESWCRYGVQDSTSLAIELELRYRGLRAPHKIKMAVSGCVRECAEAQSKDIGVIATETGWNLYVAGNGGARPQHATLLASDLDHDGLVRSIDRFLMLYIRTADRLERTATWFNKLEGGVEHLRQVLIDDSLGLGADLDSAMAAHVATYHCEWKATLESPERLARFRTFVNSSDPDPDIEFVTTRGQIQPVPVSLRARPKAAVV